MAFAIIVPKTEEEAVAQVKVELSNDMQILGATPIQGGFIVSSKHVSQRIAEVQLFQSKTAPNQIEEPGPPTTNGQGLSCVAHFERPEEEGPFDNTDEILAHLATICKSLRF